MEGYGKRIQNRRKALDMSTVQLAIETDLSVASIQAYEGEYRRPNDENKMRIAKALKTTVSELFFKPI